MAKFTLHPANTTVFDFTNVPSVAPPRSKAGKRHMGDSRLSSNPKAIRNRTRRRGKITVEEFNTLYKPLDEWDEEELAKGRPRAKDGTFRGGAPQWLTREMHEHAMERFKAIIGDRMRSEAVTAIGVVSNLLTSEDVDERGKPIVPPSVQLQAAQWLVEHVIGKPKQRVETDISVKLQAVLATAMIGGASPGGTGADSPLALASPPPIDAEAWEDEDDL